MLDPELSLVSLEDGAGDIEFIFSSLKSNLFGMSESECVDFGDLEELVRVVSSGGGDGDATF